jgi:hypothetical protein
MESLNDFSRIEENLDGKGVKGMGDILTKIACQQLSVSNKFKQPLLTKWSSFEDLKAGKIKKKLRVQFNVALPVFSGMLDTLASDFDEPIELEFQRKHPSDYFKVQRIQAVWNLEKVKLKDVESFFVLLTDSDGIND